jgi:hypothetical protein
VLGEMGEGKGIEVGDGNGVGHEILLGDVGDLEGFWRAKVAKLGGGFTGGGEKLKVGGSFFFCVLRGRMGKGSCDETVGTER